MNRTKDKDTEIIGISSLSIDSYGRLRIGIMRTYCTDEISVDIYDKQVYYCSPLVIAQRVISNIYSYLPCNSFSYLPWIHEIAENHQEYSYAYYPLFPKSQT